MARVGPGVAGLLLAAGSGSRLGQPKALVRLHGRLLVERAAQVLAAAGCDPVVVVLGARAEDARTEADLSGCTVVVNRDWATGMGSSLRTGIAELAGTTADAALVSLVDTPGVGVEAMQRLVSLAADGAAPVLAVATYAGRRGHPVLLGRDHWTGVVESASGDAGARGYLAARADQVRLVPCEDVADPTDIDTADDLQRLRNR